MVHYTCVPVMKVVVVASRQLSSTLRQLTVYVVFGVSPVVCCTVGPDVMFTVWSFSPQLYTSPLPLIVMLTFLDCTANTVMGLVPDMLAMGQSRSMKAYAHLTL